MVCNMEGYNTYICIYTFVSELLLNENQFQLGKTINFVGLNETILMLVKVTDISKECNLIIFIVANLLNLYQNVG